MTSALRAGCIQYKKELMSEDLSYIYIPNSAKYFSTCLSAFRFSKLLKNVFKCFAELGTITEVTIKTLAFTTVTMQCYLRHHSYFPIISTGNNCTISENAEA